MASNRDPQKDYRINRRGRKVTSSADRSKRSKKASAPKPTSSSTRSRGKGTGSKKVTSSKDRVTKKPVTGPSRGAQGPAQAPQQGPTRAVKGLIGSRGPSGPSKPPTGGKPSITKVGRQLKPTMKSPAAKAGKIAAGLRGGPVTAALTVIGEAFREAKKTAAQGKTSRQNRSAPAKAMSKKLPKVKMPKVDNKKAKMKGRAESFDKAFAAARKSGKEVFIWRGKKYNTKMK